MAIKKEITTKEPFRFSYTSPTSDWFIMHDVVLNPDDYYYYEIQRRFGPSWWLVGKNPPKENSGLQWSEESIGEISEYSLMRFIEWAKGERGSKITSISAICGSFDILEDIKRILKMLENAL